MHRCPDCRRPVTITSGACFGCGKILGPDLVSIGAKPSK